MPTPDACEKEPLHYIRTGHQDNLVTASPSNMYVWSQLIDSLEAGYPPSVTASEDTGKYVADSGDGPDVTLGPGAWRLEPSPGALSAISHRDGKES